MKFTTVMGVIVTIMLCLIMAGVIGSGAIRNTFLGLLVRLVVVVSAGTLTGWLANSINQKDITLEERQKRKNVKNCARIKSLQVPGLFDKTG